MITKGGAVIAIILFIVLLIKFFAQLPGSTLSPSEKGNLFVQILIISIVILVIAVPEGLPLAVTLALAYATTRMMKDNNLVRVLKSCETMGNVTTVCSDKTGTLTQNKMTVIVGTLGVTDRFGELPQMIAKFSSSESGTPTTQGSDVVIALDALFKELPSHTKTLLRQSIAINSTAFEGFTEKGVKEYIGSKTETALLEFARKHLKMEDLVAERESLVAVHHIPFDSKRKFMGVVVKIPSQGHRLFIKGASEIVLKHTTQVLNPRSTALVFQVMTDEDRASIDKNIGEYASSSLRTIGLAYRDFVDWPLEGAADPSNPETMFANMTWIGVVGIMDPLREGVIEAVRDCQTAGVKVRMVTGDNVNTARAIAFQCGIYSGGVIMDGPTFRNLSQTERVNVSQNLEVLARSSPEDKYVLVKTLKSLGETVAVTGDGTNDGPALRIADVGFSMGVTGTEVAKEASDIILMDDNFSSIVKAILWGRCVGDAVKKFLQVSYLATSELIQFQLTVNVSAVLLSFVSAIASGQEQSVLNPVQLLWVNLIQDTFAALALATDPPTLKLLYRNPDSRDASIINFNMWKMIIGQSILQLAITFVLAFAGVRIFNWSQLEISSVVFNTYVWLQISNQFNCRRIDNHLNVFSGVHRNFLFLLITFITVCGQIIIVFVGGTAFSVTPLNGIQWAVSIVLGLLSLPFGAIIRIIPNTFINRFIPPRFTKTTKPARHKNGANSGAWTPDREHDDLNFVKRVRSQRRLGGLGRPLRRSRGELEIELSSRRPFDEASQIEEQFVSNSPI